MESLRIAETQYPSPFASGLEFNPPVRGPWNIVHMALQIPEAHLLYICARGCLRGVLMTCAEMGAMDRMHWVGVREHDLATGELDATTLRLATHVIAALKTTKPPLIMVYLSCIHKCTQMDYPALLEGLRSAFPEIRFIGCHMMPTMRKSGPTDEERTRAQMYEALSPCQPITNAVTILGSDWPLAKNSVLKSALLAHGIAIRELPTCKSFADYQNLAQSATMLSFAPQALLAATSTCSRLGRKHLHLPLCYPSAAIKAMLAKAQEGLGIAIPSSQAEERADHALRNAKKTLGDRPIHIDYTATVSPLSLARLLIEYHFCVSTLYLDAFAPHEEEDYAWLKEHAPDLRVCPTIHPSLRLERVRKYLNPEGDSILAIGQKAAYLSGTRFFVNTVNDMGHLDFGAQAFIASAMLEAQAKPKDPEIVLQQKGLGLPSCWH
ncbi:MAG: hypothetical protein IJS54_06360 [Desulfovibrio sp.]|nr:hypothetical protein [Desulfovibrio sp.]